MDTALIISTTGDGVQRDMIDPLWAQRRTIASACSVRPVRIQADSFSAMRDAIDAQRPAVCLLATSWRESAEDTLAFFQALRESHPDTRIAYLDSFDSTSTPYFGILPYVDCYVKKQVLADLDQYNADLAGGYVFADFLHRTLGWDLDDWYFGSTIPEGYADRIVTGWNLGITPRLIRSLRMQRLMPWRTRKKDIAVHSRLGLRSVDGSDWYSRIRLDALKLLDHLGQDHHVIATGGLPGSDAFVPVKQYIREMRRSRIAFSPFGWGELCYRDFEAACFDCLLVKPSVAHLRTEPDIFIEHETYVPVKWDMSDLEDVCRHYLEHPDEADRIIRNAQAAYRNYIAGDHLTATITGVFDRLLK